MGGLGEAVGGVFGSIGAGMTQTADYQQNPYEVQAREQQQANLQQLTNKAAGQAPSAAKIQGDLAREQNMNATLALANSGRGQANVLNQKNAINSIAQANQQSLQAQSATAAQEQMAYQNMLSQNIAQQRQQDLAVTGIQNNIAQGNAESANAATGGLISGGMGALGEYLGSDEKLKKDIKSGEKEIVKFMEELDPTSFEYKDEKFGKGEQVGILAQDLEKSKVGKGVVIKADEGKLVSLEGSVPKLLAAVANLHDRIKKMES